MGPLRGKLVRPVFEALRKTEAALREAGVARERVLVAVSGGGDSMALLELAALAAPPARLELVVAHVDHGLRPEGPLERALVAAAARRVRATFVPLRLRPGATDENSLREARYRALAAAAADGGCRRILLGHTGDDQIETIVLRFFRGAGFGGLSGMRTERDLLVRPLLDLRREDLRSVLRALGQTWIEDPSNRSAANARGRLRTSLFPVLERLFGAGALDHLLEVAPRWRADEDYLGARALEAESYVRRRGRAGNAELDVAALGELHPALRSRVVLRWLGACAGGRTFDVRHLRAVEALLVSREGSGSVALPSLQVRLAGGRLVAADAAAPTQARDASAAAGEERANVVLPPSRERVTFPRRHCVSQENPRVWPDEAKASPSTAKAK